MQSLDDVHVEPTANVPQEPLRQCCPLTQSVSAAQVREHTPPSPAHWKGAQVVGWAATQWPVPSQEDPVTAWFAVESQDLPPQGVPLGQKAHDPLPSQAPFRPQLPASVAAHAGWGAVAACPSATGEQVPTRFGKLHCWQLPVQSVSQQTPSTQ